MNEQKQSEYMISGGTFVYALNARGTNRIYASIQPGHGDDGSRTPQAELVATAQLFAAAPDLLESLRDTEQSLREAAAMVRRAGWATDADDFDRAADNASAAIARATGQKGGGDE